MTTTLHIHREQHEGRTTLWLEGAFDGSAAEQLTASLAELEAPVVVDFSQVRRFQDAAVAALSRTVREGVYLRGLATHHERLMRYFGLELEQPGERSVYRPEDTLGI